ncbi:hypothetical protein [uncultured Caballeronia sp.]|uniref:hypothetical protein n=1 Tax=uncultured Caballeronia sp. TaxID=1827198 RepID=UPI001576F4A2
MQFLIQTSRTAEFESRVSPAALQGEEAQLRHLYATEVVRHIWHRYDRPGAVMLVEADDGAHAVHSVESLPLVSAGLVTIDEVTPLKPYAGFCRT